MSKYKPAVGDVWMYNDPRYGMGGTIFRYSDRGWVIVVDISTSGASGYPPGHLWEDQKEKSLSLLFGRSTYWHLSVIEIEVSDA
jgi:hypothetical protein